MSPALPRRWVAAVALLLALPAAAPAQSRPPVTTDGFDFFRAALWVNGVRPFASVEDVINHAVSQDAILVVIGDSEPGSDYDRARWTRRKSPLVEPLPLEYAVLLNGGAVLIATNSRFEVQLPSGGSVVADGEPVQVTRPEVAHGANVRSPYVVPFPASASPDPVRDLFAGLSRIATQTPCTLSVNPPAELNEARFTAASYPQGSRYSFAFAGEPVDVRRKPFAVGGTGPYRRNRTPYRFLMMGDHHVLSNGLIAEGPDNLEFTRRLARFLHDPDGVRRTRCAFFEHGRLVTDFNSAWRALPRPPDPPIPVPALGPLQEKLVDIGNQLVDRVEEKNLLNQLLLGEHPSTQNRRLRDIMRGLAVVAAVWAVWFVLRRVWKARQPVDQPRPPTPTGAAPPSGPTGIFTRREQELLRRNNVYEPARDLIRQVFAEAGAPHDAGPKPPPVHFEESARKPARLQKAIDELWRVAYGRPAVLTVQRWQELGVKLEMVRLALADGAWRFMAAAATRGGNG